MKNCNFISAGAAAAKTYVECEKNEANLFHRRVRARALMASNRHTHTQMPAHIMHSLIPVKRQIHKKHKPKQSSRSQPPKNEARKENNAALKRAIVCRTSFFIPIGFSSLDFHYIYLFVCTLEFPRLAGPF